MSLLLLVPLMLQAGIPTVADVSAVTGVTAVACNLAIIVEVLFDPAVRNNLASVGVS